METMLMDSLTHAKDDMAVRALLEASTEAVQMLDTTQKFLLKHKAELAEEEITTTQLCMQALRDAIAAKQKDKIQHATETLNDVSRPFAERVMDAALKDAMRGKKIV